MKLYILTSEPYHDNSCIFGVYLTPDEPLRLLREELAKREQNVNDNYEDEELREWDADTQTSKLLWRLTAGSYGKGGYRLMDLTTETR